MAFADIPIGTVFTDNRIQYRRMRGTWAERLDTGSRVSFYPSDVVWVA